MWTFFLTPSVWQYLHSSWFKYFTPPQSLSHFDVIKWNGDVILKSQKKIEILILENERQNLNFPGATLLDSFWTHNRFHPSTPPLPSLPTSLIWMAREFHSFVLKKHVHFEENSWFNYFFLFPNSWISNLNLKMCVAS